MLVIVTKQFHFFLFFLGGQEDTQMSDAPSGSNSQSGQEPGQFTRNAKFCFVFVFIQKISDFGTKEKQKKKRDVKLFIN